MAAINLTMVEVMADEKYWKKLMGISEVSMILQVRVTDLKRAIHYSEKINGELPPKVVRVTNTGALIFSGSDVKNVAERMGVLNKLCVRRS